MPELPVGFVPPCCQGDAAEPGQGEGLSKWLNSLDKGSVPLLQ